MINEMIKRGLKNLVHSNARIKLTIIGFIISIISIVIVFLIESPNHKVNEEIKNDENSTVIYIYQEYDWDESSGEVTYVAQLDDELLGKIKEIEHVKGVSPLIGKSLRLKSGDLESYLYLQIIDFSTAANFGYPNLKDGTSLSKDINNKIIISDYDLSNFTLWLGSTPESKKVDLTKDIVIAEFDDYLVPEEGKERFSISLNEAYGFFDVDQNSQYAYSSYMDIDYFKEIYTKYADTLKEEDRNMALKSLKVYEQIIVKVDDVQNVPKVVENINELGVSCNSAVISNN